MVQFKTIKTIQLSLATHIFVHLGARHGRPGMTKQEALRLADNPVVQTADDGSDYLWFWIDAAHLGSYRFGFNTSALFPANIKIIQKLDDVSNTWQEFWQDT